MWSLVYPCGIQRALLQDRDPSVTIASSSAEGAARLCATRASEHSFFSHPPTPCVMTAEFSTCLQLCHRTFEHISRHLPPVCVNHTHTPGSFESHQGCHRSPPAHVIVSHYIQNSSGGWPQRRFQHPLTLLISLTIPSGRGELRIWLYRWSTCGPWYILAEFSALCSRIAIPLLPSRAAAQRAPHACALHVQVSTLSSHASGSN